MRRSDANSRSTTLKTLVAASALVGMTAAGCNSHPVDYARTAGAVEHQTNFSLGSGGKVDILWVIDNSQSMCQEQRNLRDNFPKFIDKLYESPVDFNLAVTTTHMAKNSAFEKVAQPGHIQSTPSPVTGFDPTCRFQVDASGEPIDHDYMKNGTTGPDYTPVKNQIEQAVQCTANPQKWQGLTEASRATIECALFGNDPKVDPNACDKAGKDPKEFRTEDLFPPQDAYRDIPKVLRASAYQNEDLTLDREQLRKDFDCMSFVGTRGASSEQGLRAAVRAVSPELTGGPTKQTFDSPKKRAQFIEQKRKQYPNYGFLRKDAKTAVIFVTDENDCSHKGNIIQEQSRSNSCDEANCYFPTSEAPGNQDPLLSTKKLYQDFLKNLAKSKGVEKVDPKDVFVASIHGKSKPYDGPEPKMCKQGVTYVTPVCAGPLGQAKSGDRYENFIRNFENFFPKPNENNPDAPLTGYMCRGTLGPALKGIGSFFELGETQCLVRHILPCSANKDCPDYVYGKGRDNVCQPWGETDTKFCDSAVQVRIKPRNTDLGDKAARDLLKNSGLCAEGSIAQPEYPEGCVVNRSKFSWITCEGRDAGDAIQMNWNDDVSKRVLADFKGEIRFTTVSEGDGGSDEGEGDNDGGNGSGGSSGGSTGGMSGGNPQ